MKKFLALAAAALLCFALVGCSSSSDDNGGSTDTGDSLRFVTGGESGTYYAFGSVIAQHATNNAGIAVTALSSGGSQENIESITDGNAEFGFCQSDVMSYAYAGTNFDAFKEAGANTSFSTVASLYQEQVQIVTCDPDIKTIADLKGKNVSIGAPGSGVYFNAIDILGAYGITESDINPTYQSFADSTDALKNNTIDAAFVVAGAPTTSITDLSASKQAYLVSLDSEHVAKLMEQSSFYAEAVIPAGTYSGIDNDVTTVSVGAVIIASNKVDEDAVYKFVADILDNASSLTDSHAKYAEVSLEGAASITTVPYHKGAAKYFSEKGITVPTAE